MYYYIYRISNTLKSKLENLNLDELNKFNNQIIFSKYNNYLIEGYIDFEYNPLINSKINFEIDLDSLFLFIETNHQKILNKSINTLEPFFNEQIGGELENFIPKVSNEHNLICKSEDYHLKFFYKGDIVDSDTEDELDEKYCCNKLDPSYNLIEADIYLENNISFYYFRKSIDIIDESNKEYILKRFKEVMV